MTDATTDATLALPDSLALYQEIMGGYGERVKNAHGDGKLLGWLDSLFGATELFWTMGIVPFTPVSNAIALFTAGQGYDYLELGERHGITPEMCSAHRVVVGMAHERLLDPPDLLVSTAHCCDSGLKVFEILSDFYGCPNYFWDCGYGLDQASMDYYKGEIQGLIGFLEERTGRPLDWDRLKEALHLSRRALDCWRQIGELRQAVPCPSGFNEGMRDFTIMASCSGLPEAVRYFERRHERAKQENAQGRRIVGWVCTYVPEEILHAAGLLPVRVVGAGRETPQADAHLYTNLCTFARSALEEGFGGHYDYLDGLVTCNTCDSIRRLYDAWSLYLPTPFTHLLSLPHKFTESAVLYFRQQLVGLKGAMEEQFGVEISEEALRRSIALYNRTRTLLRQLYDLRRADSPPLTGSEALEVVLAGMVLPKEEYNAMLEELLRELSARPLCALWLQPFVST